MSGFQMPDGVRRALEEKGWDGETIFPPEGEQAEMPVDADPEPDADLDALFGKPTDDRAG